jgi:AcrR family transcriptional regulator
LNVKETERLHHNEDIFVHRASKQAEHPDCKGTGRSLLIVTEATLMTKGQQTRRKIVEAAAPIFNQRGYEGTSLNDLMEATGFQKGGIYRHFSSKEELAAEASEYTWDAARKARLLHVDEEAERHQKAQAPHRELR